MSQIGHGLLGAADLLLLLAQLVRKGDEEAAVALALVGWEGKDAREVVADVRVLLLAVVSHGMVACGCVD